jgi:2-dehydropantoate 2-reductase
MRFAVIGVGGSGGLLGARLINAKYEVAFIARGETLEAIRRHGLKVESASSSFVVHPAQLTDDPRELGSVDCVILGVNTWQVASAARTIAPLLREVTVVLPLQNGIGAVAQLSAALRPEHVLGCAARMSSINVAPGHIRHSALAPSLEIGELDARKTPRLERLCDALSKARVNATISPNVQVTMWMKFLLIAPWAGIAALSRVPIGNLRSLPETRKLLRDALVECERVGRALDVPLPADAVAHTLAELDALPPHVTVSMQRDIVAGRPSELEALTATVVRLGTQVGVATPIHTLVYHLLLPLERTARAGL